MNKTALLAKTAGPALINAADDQAALRRMVVRVLQEEYGDHAGIWEQAAKRAACRIVEAIESVKTNRL